MKHLKAVVLIRHSIYSVQALKDEFKHPKYTEYHVLFNTVLHLDILKQIAQDDRLENYKTSPRGLTLNMKGTLRIEDCHIYAFNSSLKSVPIFFPPDMSIA